LDPITGIGLIGSACSVASFMRRNQLDATFENIRDAIPQVSQGMPEKQGQTEKQGQQKPQKFQEFPFDQQFQNVIVSPAGIDLIKLLIIDEDLLKFLAGNARRAQVEYRKCIKAATNSQGRDACDRQVERRVCEALNRIMDRNGGSLPDLEDLANMWQSYGCARVASS